MQAVKIASDSESVKCGKGVVISLQSVLDNEPEQTECSVLDLATPKAVLQNLVRKHFPLTLCWGLMENRQPNSSGTNITTNEKENSNHTAVIMKRKINCHTL